MILVTGASGNVGSQVLKALVRSGQPVKALYRTSADAAKAPSGMKTTIADFADSASLKRALDGIEKVFLVCAPIPQLIELECKVIAACKHAGVKYLVLNSALGAGTFDSSFPSWHAQVEEDLKQSGILYTVIRPNSFMQNLITYYAPSIRSQGAFYASMGKARASFIDTCDIAEFIAKLFGSADHLGKIYELNGPEALTYDEVAQRISQASGKAVRYIDIPVAQQKQALQGLGMSEWQVNALLELQRYYTEGGGGEIDNLFKQVVGREPTRLSQFLQEFAGEFVGEAKSA